MIYFLIIITVKISYQQQEIIQISTQDSSNLIEKRNTKEKDQYYNLSITDKTTSYCSFFNNRAPSTQINLKNCTW